MIATNTIEAADNLADRVWRSAKDFGDWIVDHRVDLLVAGIAALFLILLLLALRRFGHRLIRDRDEEISWRTIFGRVLARTGLIFIIVVAAKLVTVSADPPAIVERTVDVLFVVFASLQAAIWARELLLGYIEHRIGEREAQGRLSSAISIIRLLVSVALFAIAIIVILDNLGANVTGLVAGLGIGGIAIGLAAQGIFSDLFAALSIIFDRPFRRGDTISFGTNTGTVEQIGLKTTRIRSLGGEEIVIGNSKLLEQHLQNWAMLHRRRVIMTLGVIYQTSPEILARIPAEIRAIVERQPLAEYDRAHASAFNASSIDFELVFYVQSAEYRDFMDTKQEIMFAILRRFNEMGVQFAYPTQTTYTAAPDGTMVLPYPTSLAVEPSSSSNKKKEA